MSRHSGSRTARQVRTVEYITVNGGTSGIEGVGLYSRHPLSSAPSRPKTRSLNLEPSTRGPVLATAGFRDGTGGAVIDMAAAGAVLEFGHGIPRRSRGLGFLVWIRLEVTGVTTGTGPGVGTKFPGDYFVVACVAATAGNAAVVCAVARAGVCVTHRRPTG